MILCYSAIASCLRYIVNNGTFSLHANLCECGGGMLGWGVYVSFCVIKDTDNKKDQIF